MMSSTCFETEGSSSGEKLHTNPVGKTVFLKMNPRFQTCRRHHKLQY